MELEHDHFIVNYDASKVTIAGLLKACEESGYPAAVVDNPPDASDTRENNDAHLPRFYVDALGRAKKEQKPVVLDFGAKWCVPCQRMEKETLTDSRVTSLLAHCVLVKIDADEHAALISKYGVSGVPDVRFLSPDGLEKKRLVDFQDAKLFAEELTELLGAKP